MRFFLYDNLDRLIAIKTKAISANLSEEMGYSDSLKAEFPKTAENIKDFRHTMHIGIPVAETNEYQLFKMERPEIKDSSIYISAVDASNDDLEVQGYIDDRRFYDSKLSDALKAVFDGSQWDFELHAPDETSSTNFYKISRKKALDKVIQAWNVEVQFRYKTEGTRIAKKVCEVYKEIGQDTNKRLVKGKNVTSFEFAKDQTELYTAAVGRGAGLALQDDEGNNTGGYSRALEFDDAVWSKEAGNPVDKPKGQKYVEIPESTARWGWIDQDGQRRPRMAVVDFANDKDVDQLLDDTYQWLLARSEPRISVSTTVEKIGPVHLGDRMIAIDYDYSTLTVRARVRKINRDLLNDSNTEVQLGNYVILSQLERDEMAQDYVDSLVKRTQDQITDETDNKLQDQQEHYDTYLGQIQDAMKKEGEDRKQAIDKLKQDLQLTSENLSQHFNEALDTMNQDFTEELQTKVGKENFNKVVNGIKADFKKAEEEAEKKFNDQVETINSDLENINRNMNSNTSGRIQLIKDPQDPTKILEMRINNDDGSGFQLNGNGVVYRDRWGNIKTAFTADGHVAGSVIDGAIINSLQLNSASISSGSIDSAAITGTAISGGSITGTNIYGSYIQGGTITGGQIYGPLEFYTSDGGSMAIHIGSSGYGGLSPDNGGEAMFVTSNNYTSMVSSGQVAVTGYNGTTRVHPGYIEVNGNTVLHAGNWRNYISFPDVPSYSQIRSWVRAWVADYVTETGNKGHRLIIWKG